MISIIYGLNHSACKHLFLNTAYNSKLKLDSTMFYVTYHFESIIYSAYALCNFLKNKTHLTGSANVEIDAYIQDYEDLKLAIKNNITFDELHPSILEKTAENLIDKYFTKIKFCEPNITTIINIRLELCLETLFSKNNRYRRIINIDSKAIECNSYVMYEIEETI